MYSYSFWACVFCKFLNNFLPDYAGVMSNVANLEEQLVQYKDEARSSKELIQEQTNQIQTMSGERTSLKVWKNFCTFAVFVLCRRLQLIYIFLVYYMLFLLYIKNGWSLYYSCHRKIMNCSRSDVKNYHLKSTSLELSVRSWIRNIQISPKSTTLSK